MSEPKKIEFIDIYGVTHFVNADALTIEIESGFEDPGHTEYRGDHAVKTAPRGYYFRASACGFQISPPEAVRLHAVLNGFDETTLRAKLAKSEGGRSECLRRYKRCIQALRVCRLSLTRQAWEDGPTETEALDECNELINEFELEEELKKP